MPETLAKDGDSMPDLNLLKTSAVWTWLGLEVVEAANGRAVVSLAVREHYLQAYGHVHGGLITTLLDAAMGAALASATPVSSTNVTTNLAVHYLAPAPGRFVGCLLTAEGTVLRAGKHVAVISAVARDPDGTLLATATGQFSIRRPDASLPS